MRTKLLSFSGWGIVIAASLYFIYNNALHYFSYNVDSYGPDFYPVYAPSLLIHVVGGLLALVLGPFQFMSSIRKKYPLTHRFMGKTYLLAVLVAGLASLNLSINKIIIGENLIAYGAGLAGLALAWLSTSAMAFWAARSRNFVQHREWMVKSFVVTCGFTSFRLIDKILTEKFHVDPMTSSNLLAWGCWAIPLLVTDLVLQGQKISRGNRALAKNNTRTS
jgi:uncharacterized membrane protein